MVKVKIYAEGGGNGELLHTLFRKAWADFFRTAGFEGRMPSVVRGKGRQQAYNLFKTAVQNSESNVLPLLLVDSEDAVDPNHTVWEHLKSRDGWDQPEGAESNDAFLMVRVMETWLLADRAALRNYFGSKLKENTLVEWHKLESVPKDSVLNALEKATAGCKTKYAKGRVSFELLSTLNPAEVEKRCPHAQRLLSRLRNL